MDETKRKRRIAIMQSDLRDSWDPRVLAKYPHLGDPVYVSELKQKLAELQGREIT